MRHYQRILGKLLVTIFRDPHFYLAFRDRVIPALRTYPRIKIWHAGCVTGEEPFPMAIMLHEEGLLEQAEIVATDINEDYLSVGRQGVYPAAEMRAYEDLDRRGEERPHCAITTAYARTRLRCPTACVPRFAFPPTTC